MTQLDAPGYQDDDLVGFKIAEKVANKSTPTLWRYIKEGVFPQPEKIVTPSGKRIFLGFKWKNLREWRENPSQWAELNCGRKSPELAA